MQEKFKQREAAIRRAQEIYLNPRVHTPADNCVSVTESRGEFFVEDGVPMTRTWERLVWLNGKEQ